MFHLILKTKKQTNKQKTKQRQKQKQTNKQSRAYPTKHLIGLLRSHQAVKTSDRPTTFPSSSKNIRLIGLLRSHQAVETPDRPTTFHQAVINHK